jgi:hypothetical protein
MRTFWLLLASATLTLSINPSVAAQTAGTIACPTTLSPTKGQNAVTCKGTTVTAGASYAYVDASGWVNGQNNPQGDICSVISDILTNATTSGPITIDARGLFSSNTPPHYVCVNSPFPSGLNRPATILLPAGQNIFLETPWVVPSGTRIVGSGPYGGTTLSPNSSIPSATTALITLCGGASGGCTDISIENISIQYPAVGQQGFTAQQSLITGIENNGGGDQTYVSNVSFTNLSGIGLLVDSNAARSGPYTNIGYNDWSCETISGTTTCPVCAYIKAQTRGLKGFSCIGDSTVTASAGHPAIIIQASNNTVEDVHIESFWDGVQIGALPGGSAVNNVFVANVTAHPNGSASGPVTNAVHICGNNSNGSFGSCGGATGSFPAVTDVVLHGISISGAQKTVTAVGDDVSGTPLTGTGLTVGFYAIGQNSVNGVSTAFAKFSSTPGTGANIPTWGVGSSAVPTTSTGCSTPGSLFSNTSGTSGSANTIYVCSSGFVWTSLPNL